MNWITIPDDFSGHSLDLFNIPPQYKETIESGKLNS